MIKLGDIQINVLIKEDLFIRPTQLKWVITVNAEMIVLAHKNTKLMSILNEHYTTIDGQIPFWVSRLRYHGLRLEKLSGSDLIYDFCDFAQKNRYGIFLLGGKLASNIVSVKRIKERYKIAVGGYSPPLLPLPFTREEDTLILRQIEEAHADILFVAFGALKQELWIDQHFEELKNYGIKWVLGVGGTLEFLSGQIRRAPRIVQNIGLEGVYRLIQEPKKYRLVRLLKSLLMFKYI